MASVEYSLKYCVMQYGPFQYVVFHVNWAEK